MSWDPTSGGSVNAGGGNLNAAANPYGQATHPQQYQPSLAQQQQSGTVLQQHQSPAGQLAGGSFVGGYQQQQGSQQQQQQFAGVGVASPVVQHGHLSITQPHMVSVRHGQPQQHPQGIVYTTLQAASPLQLPMVHHQQPQAQPQQQPQVIHPWQAQRLQQQQQQGMAYYQPTSGEASYQVYRAGMGGGGAGRVGAGHGGHGGRGGYGSPSNWGGGSAGDHGERGAGGAPGGRGGAMKKRGRVDESAADARGKGRGKGTSKGGAKASRRESDGGRGVGAGGQGFPPPAERPAKGSAASAAFLMDDDGDGVPYANALSSPSSQGYSSSSYSNKSKAQHMPSSSKRAKKKAKKGGGPVPSQAGGTGSTPAAAVEDVDRAAGEGHWANLMNNTENVNAIELNPAKRAAAAAVAMSTVKDKRGQGTSRPPGGNNAPTSNAKPPTPMKESPKGSGQMVVDEEANRRMYPGGAVLNMKAFKLKQKSAVSAAFELCVAMTPKARPSFEFKGGTKTATAPFTLHVEVNGVAYTPATAKSIKLAKQLASINFLRECVGTREELNLTPLMADSGGIAAGSEAVAAAIKQKKPHSKQQQPAGEGGAEGGEGEGQEGDSDKKADAAAKSGAAAAAGSAAAMDEDAVAKLALDSGIANYAQLLHDLVAAHPETPAYTSYTYKANKETPRKTNKLRSGGFHCKARLLRHTVDAAETANRKKVEEEKKAAEAEAKAAAEADPDNETLAEAASKAHDDLVEFRSRPMLSINVLTSEGDGASKRDSKHRAAEAMIYQLLPNCKNEAEIRAESKAIMERYQVEKKARIEEEQRVALKAKSLREAAKTAKEKANAARKSGKCDGETATLLEAEAAATDAAAGEAEAKTARVISQPEPTRPNKVLKEATVAVKKGDGAEAGDSAMDENEAATVSVEKGNGAEAGDSVMDENEADSGGGGGGGGAGGEAEGEAAGEVEGKAEDETEDEAADEVEDEAAGKAEDEAEDEGGDGGEGEDGVGSPTPEAVSTADSSKGNAEVGGANSSIAATDEGAGVADASATDSAASDGEEGGERAEGDGEIDVDTGATTTVDDADSAGPDGSSEQEGADGKAEGAAVGNGDDVIVVDDEGEDAGSSVASSAAAGASAAADPDPAAGGAAAVEETPQDVATGSPSSPAASTSKPRSSRAARAQRVKRK